MPGVAPISPATTTTRVVVVRLPMPAAGRAAGLAATRAAFRIINHVGGFGASTGPVGIISVPARGVAGLVVMGLAVVGLIVVGGVTVRLVEIGLTVV